MTSVWCLRPQLGILEARCINSRIDGVPFVRRRKCRLIRPNVKRCISGDYNCADESQQDRVELPGTSSPWSPRLTPAHQLSSERRTARSATLTVDECIGGSTSQCADITGEGMDVLAAQLAHDVHVAGFRSELAALSDSESRNRLAVNEASREAQRERMRRRKSERSAYLVAAIASSIGFTSLAAGAVVYRFVSQMQAGGEIPYLEIGGTFALAIGAAVSPTWMQAKGWGFAALIASGRGWRVQVGMEYWACWAHRVLWHASLWHMHESHHVPRTGPFELNDIFAIINAAPAILLLAYGFFTKGFFPGLCFGAGLGITLFGISYMFVHDGLVHRRFPVGPLADVPFFQRVAAAHKLHHAEKYAGVPYGLFLGPQELRAVGGLADLEDMLAANKLQTLAVAAAATAAAAAVSGGGKGGNGSL